MSKNKMTLSRYHACPVKSRRDCYGVISLSRSAGNRLTIFIICCLSLLFSVSYVQEEFTYDARGKRNPFIPLITSDGRFLQLDQEAEKKEEELIVEGIIYDEHGVSYAVVQGEVVTVGENIAGYQVLKIEKNKVTFVKGGQVSEFVLTEEEE